ncbi:MAG: DUF86 domain-containing protein [Acidobacteriia bacterium]|nr:DUF86 domain-containing protein [Terriglobia bacterium]MYK12256.1 DUF86 domain-containing protein [Terriglobia bacterium]
MPVAVEAALALCYHVSLRRLRTAPADWASRFGLLEDAGILAPDLTERLKNVARLRNPLVRVYRRVDNRQANDAPRKSLGDFRAFSAAIVSLLDG